jgi:hypothetical protein
MSIRPIKFFVVKNNSKRRKISIEEMQYLNGENILLEKSTCHS